MSHLAKHQSQLQLFAIRMLAICLLNFRILVGLLESIFPKTSTNYLASEFDAHVYLPCIIMQLNFEPHLKTNKRLWKKDVCSTSSIRTKNETAAVR